MPPPGSACSSDILMYRPSVRRFLAGLGAYPPTSRSGSYRSSLLAAHSSSTEASLGISPTTCLAHVTAQFARANLPPGEIFVDMTKTRNGLNKRIKKRTAQETQLTCPDCSPCVMLVCVLLQMRARTFSYKLII